MTQIQNQRPVNGNKIYLKLKLNVKTDQYLDVIFNCECQLTQA